MEAIYQQINAGASCTMKFQIRGCTLRGVSVNFIFFFFKTIKFIANA